MDNPIIQILVLVLVFILALYFFVYKKPKESAAPNTVKPHKFVLCSQASIDYAVSLIQFYAKQEGFHSYDIYETPDDLRRSFYFLMDCYYFCEKTPYYKNPEWLKNVRVVYHGHSSTPPLSVPSSEIPTDKMERFKFGMKHKKRIESELEDFGQIYWRNKMQWLYWANIYRDYDELNKHCIEIANSIKD